MRFNLKSTLLASIAILVGVIVLAGYFIQLPALVELRDILLRWAVILAAVALLVGMVNLMRVHWHRIRARQGGGFYSLVLLISLVLTVLIAGIFGPTSDQGLWIFNYIQVPIESSLMAILAIVLAYASARLFRQRVNLFSVIFVGTVLFILVATITLPGFEIPGLRDLRSWITQVWAAAGARGILLGVGLGTIATGLRILMGADRPYGG